MNSLGLSKSRMACSHRACASLFVFPFLLTSSATSVHAAPILTLELISSAQAAPAGVTKRSAHEWTAGDAKPRERTVAERRAIDAATRLLNGGAKYPIVLIDPELAPDSAAIRRVDAFTVRELDGRMRLKVYVNLESPLLQRAADHDDFYVKALAAVLVHEFAHLAGGDEAVARVAEQSFLKELIANGAIAAADGQRYLAQLRSHRAGPGTTP